MTEKLALPKGLGHLQISALERALGHDGGATLVMADGFISWAEGPTSDTLVHRLAYLIGSTIDICEDNATETLYCSWADRRSERATAAALRRVWERMGQPSELLTSEGLRSAQAAILPPPPPAEFRWFATCPDGFSRCADEGYATHAEAADWAGWGHCCLSVAEHRIYAAPAAIPEADRVFWAPPPAQPSEPSELPPPPKGFGLPTTTRPISWECETDDGATFSLTFSDGAEEQAIHAWWMKRHDFCRPCAECRHCHHPDHENYCPADGSRWGF